MKTSIAVSARSILILRVMLSAIFIVAGAGHIFNTEKTTQRLLAARFNQPALLLGDPKILVISSGVVLLGTGLLFMLGYKTKYTAGVLILLLLGISLTVQVGQLNTIGPLFKNLAILGGLLFFVFNKSLHVSKTS